jgi:hypothetical protein
LEDGKVFTAFLEDTFRRFGGRFDQFSETAGAGPSCAQSVKLTVEHVVDETSGRLRAVPGYARRLREPVASALRSIDAMVDQIPGVLSCQRSTFAMDPHVNAFFVDHNSMREVFSTSKEVRALFDSNMGAEQCFALLCMHRGERRQLGMALVGDQLHKDVMQTAVSFSDHQVVSPGLDETAARCALKCCIFNCVVGHIRARSTQLKSGSSDLEGRARALNGRLRHLAADTPEHAAVQREIEALDTELQQQGPRLSSLEDQLRFVADSLSRLDEIVACRHQTLYVDRLGIRQDNAAATNVHELRLAEIQVATKPPRVATLVSFPRDELLPKRDFLREASLFLAA